MVPGDGYHWIASTSPAPTGPGVKHCEATTAAVHTQKFRLNAGQECTSRYETYPTLLERKVGQGGQ
jgi:hypothetical protein